MDLGNRYFCAVRAREGNGRWLSRNVWSQWSGRRGVVQYKVYSISEPCNNTAVVIERAGQAAVRAAPAPAIDTFSFVPDSGIRAAAFRPACTLGTVAFTSVMGKPWVGAMVLTLRRSIR